MHLHGHDFFILGTGHGTFTKSANLNFINPTRRDTAMVPGNGWLAIAFITDNPGAWLMHCHVVSSVVMFCCFQTVLIMNSQAWHVSNGMGLQFLERGSELAVAYSNDDLEPTCRQWREWYVTSVFEKDDSGV